MNDVGERIKACRLANKLTQAYVAGYLGIGKQAIYKYETGTVTNIPLENIEKMADLFQTSPSYLAGWSDQETDDSSLAALNTEESRLVGIYRKLSPYGQQLLQDRADELLVLHGEKDSSVPASSIG